MDHIMQTSIIEQASPAPTPDTAPLTLNNDDELLTINPDII